MIEQIRRALRLTTTAYDEEILSLQQAALLDLQATAGVVTESMDPLILRAVITYVRMHFGAPENYAQLKASYDEQKAQLSMCSAYTLWGDGE